MKKNHRIKITITSESDGEINGRHILEEYAATPEDLVRKSFAFDVAITNACRGVAAQLAAEDGFLGGVEPEEPEVVAASAPSRRNVNP